MEKGEIPGVEKWITLGHGDEAKHVPIVDGKIGSIQDGHGAPARPLPLDILRKIHATTKDGQKKAEWEKRISAHPDSKPRTYSYGLRSRPVDIGTVPRDYTKTGVHQDFNYGTVTYDRPLSDEERKSYQLTQVAEREDIPTVAKHVHDKMGEYVQDYLDDLDDPDEADHAVRSAARDAGYHVDPKRVLDAIKRKVAGGDYDEPMEPVDAVDVTSLPPTPLHDLSPREWDARVQHFEDDYRGAESAVKAAERELIDTTPKSRERDSQEFKLADALKKPKNKELVSQLEAAKAKFEQAIDARRPYWSGHQSWLHDELKRGVDVPAQHDATYPGLPAARKIIAASRETAARGAALRKRFAESPSAEKLPAVFEDLKRESEKAEGMPGYQAAGVAATRLRNFLKEKSAPIWDKKYNDQTLTPSEKSLADWYDERGSRTPDSLLDRFSGGSNGGDHPHAKRGLLEPMLDDRSVDSAIRNAEEDRKIAVARSRIGQPIAGQAWHREQDDGGDLPQGHGVIHERGTDGQGRRYHYVKGVLQLPDGQHYRESSGKEIREEKDPDQLERDALDEARKSYEYDLEKKYSYSHDDVAKRSQMMDAMRATLTPWTKRNDRRITKAATEKDLADRMRSKAIADKEPGWKQDRDSYVKENMGKITPERKYSNGHSYYEDDDQAAERRHRELVEHAHHAGYDVPMEAVHPNVTYQVPAGLSNPGEGRGDVPRMNQLAKLKADHAEREKSAFSRALKNVGTTEAFRSAKFQMNMVNTDPVTVTGRTTGSGKWAYHKVREGKTAEWTTAHTGHGMNSWMGRERTEEDAKRQVAMLESMGDLPEFQTFHNLTPDRLRVKDERDRTEAENKAISTVLDVHGIANGGYVDRPEDVKHPVVRERLEALARNHGYTGQPEPLVVPPEAEGEWNMERVNRARAQGKPVPQEAMEKLGY